MKVKIVLALALLGGFAHSALGNEDNWESFKNEFNKNYYGDEALEQYRKEIFLNNLNDVNEHNKRKDAGDESYEMGVNQFSDMLESEIDSMFSINQFVDVDRETEIDGFEPVELANLPKHVNWTAMGAVTHVRNEGHFNNSWAFAVADVVASRQFVHSGNLTELSKQVLIDCCPSNLRDRTIYAFECIKKMKGIDTEASYRYRGLQSKCKLPRKRDIGARIQTFYHLRYHDERTLAMALVHGPVLAIISHRVQSYRGGVYKNTNCGHFSDFPVLVVGYGHCPYHGDFWILKTAFGTSWGEHGYMRLARNMRNECGIADRVYIPIISSNGPTFWRTLEVSLLLCISTFSFLLLK